MTRPATIRAMAVTRAVKGAMAAGLELGRVEVNPDGTIVMTVAGAIAPPDPLGDWQARKRK